MWGRGEANDVYSSIGLVMLVGLIAKNAILIVEFARQQRTEGKSMSRPPLRRRICACAPS